MLRPRQWKDADDLRETRQAFQEWPKPGGADSARVRAPGEDAILRKEGDRLIIEPAPPKSLLALLATLAPLDEKFPRYPIRYPIPSRSMRRYLLDTNIVSDLVRNPQGRIAEHIRKVGEAQVYTSIIVAAELRYGAAKKRSPRLSAQLEAVLGGLDVLPLSVSMSLASKASAYWPRPIASSQFRTALMAPAVPTAPLLL